MRLKNHLLLDKVPERNINTLDRDRHWPKLGFWQKVPGNTTQKDKFGHHKKLNYENIYEITWFYSRKQNAAISVRKFFSALFLEGF